MKMYIQHYQLQKYQELTLLQPRMVLISFMKFLQTLKKRKMNTKQHGSTGGNILIEMTHGIREN